MIVNVSEIFRFEMWQQSTNKDKQAFDDPYEVRKWAKYFNINPPSNLLVAYCFYLLECLKKRVEHSVQTQRIDGIKMQSIYKQLSPNYKKINKNNKGKFWIDTEFLISSIKIWQDSKRKVYFGIPQSIKHKSSGVPAYLIFRWLEFGTKNSLGKYIIPPRPLIYPHLSFILQHNSDYWARFIILIMQGKIELKG